MRSPKPITHEDGTVVYRVRYRLGGRETSETFRRLDDAELFASILGDGKPHRVTEALSWLDSKRTERESETFANWFEAWRSQLTGITIRTREDYANLHRRYLADLDPLPLTLISRTHVARIINDMDGRGLSRKTVQNCIHMLSSVLELAVNEGHITRNPVKSVRLPQQDTDEHATRFLSHDEAGALVDATAPHYQPFVVFLLGTGLRWSEATALQGRHINLDAGTVRVERAWKRIPGGQEIGPPKSKKSRRTVNAAVAALLAAHDSIRGPNDLVFTATRGGPIQRGHFYNRVWVPACEQARLDPRPRIHDTRHTFASYLISDGIGLEAVQDQLGHESYETTRKLYAHLLPAVGVAAGKSASAAMDRVLANRTYRPHLALVEPSSDADQP